MTDYERELIKKCLPNPPDPELEFGEYYYLQYTWGKPRVIKVTAFDVFPMEDGIEYGIYQKRGQKHVRIDAGYGNPFRGVRKNDLYDNTQDCRDQTHMYEDRWEQLRELQLKEGA